MPRVQQTTRTVLTKIGVTPWCMVPHLLWLLHTYTSGGPHQQRKLLITTPPLGGLLDDGFRLGRMLLLIVEVDVSNLGGL